VGADPAVIGPWIAETQAKKVTAEAEIRTATGRRQMSGDDIAAIVAALADLAQVVCEADPADKADIYAQLNLTLTYQPGQRLVEATVKPGLNMRKGSCPRADTDLTYMIDIALTMEFSLGAGGAR
jgi:hypothetical protein